MSPCVSLSVAYPVAASPDSCLGANPASHKYGRNVVPLSGLAAFSTNVKGNVDQVAIPFEPAVKPIVFRRVP